jgi:hypothetical protein
MIPHLWLLSSGLSLLTACQNGREKDGEGDFTALWDRDPGSAAERIRKMEDPIEQIAAVTELSESRPGSTTELCSLLDPGQARKRCERLNARPHLWEERKSSSPALATYRAQLPSPERIDPGCSEEENLHACIDEQARAAAGHGDLARASGLCAGIEEETWHGECLFSAAEAAVSYRGPYGYASAVELCLAAAPFVENCLNHLIMQLADGAPSASSPREEDWAIVHTAANGVRSAWNWRDPKLAEQASERLWSEALGMAYSKSEPVSGDPLDALPERLHPHVRAAAMRRLMALEPPRQHSLEEWIRLGQEVLSQRQGGSGKRDQMGRFLAAADLWVPGTDQPSIAYMATSRRTLSTDPSADLAICALEAAARRPPAHLPLLEEGTRHPSPEVRETAERLLQKVDGGQ